MRAMILAAGRGARMQHLTADLPKALLCWHERYLIEYSILGLRKIGIKEIVINVSYKADLIRSTLGDGSRYGVNIVYSFEQEALETGGGIFKALPLLGSNPFIVLSCDVVSDFDLQALSLQPEKLAHLVLVQNPVFHPAGDFCLRGNDVYLGNEKTYTFGNIGIYHPELFANCQPGKFRLGDLLKKVIQQNQVTGEYYSGFWENFGTPAQLQNTIALPERLL